MSSLCTSALASLDDSLAVLRESLGELRGAKSIDIAEVFEQLKRAAEYARIVSESVWSELPEASWQNRKELDALVAEIQKIFAARTLEQLRFRLLALATELERGRIVHRRELRVNELHQLRDQAINDLRSQARLEGTPQTLPGPQADQWIAWACSLQEPQDAEPLQALRNGFPHLDDFVANLEPSMWVAAGPRDLEILPESKTPAAKTPPEQSRLEKKKGFDEPVVSSGINLTTRVGFAQEVAAKIPVLQAEGRVLPDALASLDDSLAVVCKSLEKLEAAKSLDMAEVVQQFKMAAESAGMVRELVRSELPEATWQNREELDALIAEIQKIVEARALEHLRSRLLALATELERGRIVHRRAHRLNELNQLRDQAINELRSQAGLEGGLRTLPGPQADQWIAWADTLKEPEDAEALQAIRDGFPSLDDFVANLEPTMWIAGESPALEIPPEPGKSAKKPQPEQPRMETKRFEEPAASSGPVQIEMEAAKPSGARDEPRVPDLPGEPLPQGLESNTLTPHDVTPPRTEEDNEWIQAQERALLAGMMEIVSDPVGHFEPTVERPFTAAVFRGTSVAPTRHVGDPVGHFNPPVERPLSAQVSRRTSAAPEIISDSSTRVEKPWAEKWRRLLATPAVLGSVALLLFAVLGAVLLLRSHRNNASNSTVQAVERKIPDQTRSNLEEKGSGQSAMSTGSTTQTSSPKTAITEQSKPQGQSAAPKPKDQNVVPKPKDQSVAPNLLATTSPPKQASERDNGVLRPPSANPSNIAMAKKEEAAPAAATEMPPAIPGGSPSGVSDSVVNIVKNVPVPVSGTTEQQNVRVSSGVAHGLLVNQVAPQYPQIARQTGVQGTVVLQAVIGKDGSVQKLHVLSGPPMLTKAAMDAVTQWRYKPYQLNGEPVEVDTRINVKFTLPPE